MWEVGKEYKSRNGNVYIYVGPFTYSDGRKGAAFRGTCTLPRNDVFLAMRQEDGTTGHQWTRENDVIDPDEPTAEERKLAAKICDAFGFHFTAKRLRGEPNDLGSDQLAEKAIKFVKENNLCRN